jgi:hypothetical protein
MCKSTKRPFYSILHDSDSKNLRRSYLGKKTKNVEDKKKHEAKDRCAGQVMKHLEPCRSPTNRYVQSLIRQFCCVVTGVILGLTRTHAGRHDMKVAIEIRDCVTQIASQDERCHSCEESFMCSDGDHVIKTNNAYSGHLVAYDEFSTGMNHSRS